MSEEREKCGSLKIEEKSDDNPENGPQVEEEDALLSRRSERRKTAPRCFSPPPHETKQRRKSTTPRKSSRFRPIDVNPADILPDGTPFSCDLCKTRQVCNPNKKKKAWKVQQYRPRLKIDRNTGEQLVLCNACGIAYDKPESRRLKYPAPVVTPDMKEKHMREARDFAQSMVKFMEDADAERLFCPEYKKRPCNCIQNHIMTEGSSEVFRQRATSLLEMLKEAKRLSAQKVYDPEDGQRKPPHRRKCIGLGNGQKHSKEFGDFVLAQRKILRKDFRLCERGCQKILLYSNNFLHKKLKTENLSCRVEQKQSKAVTGKFMPFFKMCRESCCSNRCCLMAETHPFLLETLRNRARSGTSEARRVVAEMLTPSGGVGSVPNCRRFVQWVTGVGHSTVASVAQHMAATGGDREPPEHGLKKYHRGKEKVPLASEETHANSESATSDSVGATAVTEDATFVTIVFPDDQAQSHQDVDHSAVPLETSVAMETEGCLPQEVIQIVQPDTVVLPCQEEASPQIRTDSVRDRETEIVSHEKITSKYKTVTRLLSGGPPKGLQTDLDHRLSESAERREDFTAAQSIEECVSSEPPEADGNLVTPDEELAGARDAEVISSGAADAHAPSPDTAGESDPHGGGDTSDSASIIEAQRQQIAMLQKQVAEQQVQLQQQQLLQTQLISNILLSQVQQTTPSLQFPELLAAMQSPPREAKDAPVSTESVASVSTTDASLDDAAHGESHGSSAVFPQRERSDERTRGKEANESGLATEPSESTCTETLTQTKPSATHAPCSAAPTWSASGSTLSSTAVGSKSLLPGVDLSRYPLTALPGVTSRCGQSAVAQMSLLNAATTAALRELQVSKLLSQPLTPAQRQVLPELLPKQREASKQQARPVRPPPPYEVAASKSRQGSLERIVSAACVANSVAAATRSMSRATSAAIHTVPAALPTTTVSQATRVTHAVPAASSASSVPQTTHVTRRRRKSTQKPMKSPSRASTLQITPQTCEVQRENQTGAPGVQAPQLVQQLLEISHAAGDGTVTTLTLTQEQAQEILNQLNNCPSVQETSVSGVPFTQAAVNGTDGSPEECPNTVEVGPLYVVNECVVNDDTATSDSPGTTSGRTDSQTTSQPCERSVQDALRTERLDATSSPPDASPDILLLLAQAGALSPR